MERISEDVAWMVEKFDYKNKDADWKNSKDAIQRGMQKLRIDAVIDQAYASRGIERPEFGFGDRLSFLGNKIVRWIIKVPQRISRWPYKIRKKLQRRAS